MEYILLWPPTEAHKGEPPEARHGVGVHAVLLLLGLALIFEEVKVGPERKPWKICSFIATLEIRIPQINELKGNYYWGKTGNLDWFGDIGPVH